jgi:hypothetical protein
MHGQPLRGSISRRDTERDHAPPALRLFITVIATQSLSIQTIHYTPSYTTIFDPGRPYNAPLKDLPTELQAMVWKYVWRDSPNTATDGVEHTRYYDISLATYLLGPGEREDSELRPDNASTLKAWTSNETRVVWIRGLPGWLHTNNVFLYDSLAHLRLRAMQPQGRRQVARRRRLTTMYGLREGEIRSPL